MITQMVRGTLRKMGFDLVRYSNFVSPIDHKRYVKLITGGNHDAVFDVGANVGQFGESVLPFIDSNLPVISFEPLPKEYGILSDKAKKYKNWKVYDRVAIGATSGMGKMQVTQNSVSSSLLEIDANYSGSDNAGLQKVEEVDTPLKTLTEVVKEYNYERIFLKADVQGYEKPVLEGGLEVLDKVTAIHLEFSCVPHYKGQEEMSDLFAYVSSLGYVPVLFLPHVTFNAKDELQQVDIIFRRK